MLNSHYVENDMFGMTLQ